MVIDNEKKPSIKFLKKKVSLLPFKKINVNVLANNKMIETSYHQILHWTSCHQQKFLGSWWFSFVHLDPLKVPSGFPYQNNIRHEDNRWNLLFIQSLCWGNVLIMQKDLQFFSSFCLIHNVWVFVCVCVCVCVYLCILHLCILHLSDLRASTGNWVNNTTMKTVTYMFYKTIGFQ